MLLRDVSPPPFPTSPDSIHPPKGLHLASYDRCCKNQRSKSNPIRTPSVRPFAVEPTPHVQVYFHTYTAPPISITPQTSTCDRHIIDAPLPRSSSSDSPTSPRSSAASDPPPSPLSIAATHVPYAPQAASDSLVPFAVSQHTHKMGPKTGYISFLRGCYNSDPAPSFTPRWRAYSLICVQIYQPRRARHR